MQVCRGKLNTIYFCSDSVLAIGCIQKGWGFKVRPKLLKAVRKAYRELKGKYAVELRWVKGHAGVEGNEHADRLAGEAAAASKESDFRRVKYAEDFNVFRHNHSD